MPYIAPEVITEAKRMDLLTYLREYEPGELVKFSSNTYTTRTHDSLKISNGKWMWWSRGIGGKSALDYLIKVRGMDFVGAVQTIMGNGSVSFPTCENIKSYEEQPLLLPEKSPTADVVFDYLFGRGIDYEIINHCLEQELIIESLPYHNAVFIGYDENKEPKYAAYRATNQSRIMGDCTGSKKQYSFRLTAENTGEVHLFECAIDLLSFATLERMAGVMMNNTPKKENAAIELFSGFGNSDFRMKIGGTVYEVSTHFDPEGSRCVLQQFRDLILSEELLENRIIAENAKAQ